jgi:hypothetical protein
MDELDSSPDSTEADADTSASDDQTGGQTTADEPQPAKSSEPERIRGLQSAMGKKEAARQAALAERDAAIAERDQAASALAALQAEYDLFMESPDAGETESAPVAADASASAVEDEDEDEADRHVEYASPALRQNNGMAPATPRAVARPRMSEADAALREMERIMADNIAGYRD